MGTSGHRRARVGPDNVITGTSQHPESLTNTSA